MRPTEAVVGTNNLADILERVLDKGIVIAGDIKIQLADIDLLTIKIRLLVTSVDRAKELGIDWWKQDTFYSSFGASRHQRLMDENERLKLQLQHERKRLAGKIEKAERRLGKDISDKIKKTQKRLRSDIQ